MSYAALSQYQDADFPESMADVRGFEVRTRADDEKVGTVDDLVVAPDGRLRYLDVALGGFFNLKHVALPVGAAQVDRERDVVWISGTTKEQVKELPDYVGDPSTITDDYEAGVRRAYGGPAAAAGTDLYDQGRFYADRGGRAAGEARLVLSEEQLAIGKRRVQAGEVELRKTVETEHVQETVPVTREEVRAERRPLSADAAAGDAGNLTIGEETIRVPVTEEEVVVDKRVVPVEEVVVRKEAVTEERTVEADLRRERVDEDHLARAADTASAAKGAGQRAKGGAKDVKGAAKGTAKGLGDKLADAVDDVKDRADGNPRSRPGPDATDRRR
jgi:uncharacterized protein (TIGR02271 family)